MKLEPKTAKVIIIYHDHDSNDLYSEECGTEAAARDFTCGYLEENNFCWYAIGGDNLKMDFET